MNSLTHGLRIETLALPGEDADALRERLDWWNDYYRPTTPGEAELIEMAVTSGVQRRRSQRFLTAAVSEQVRSAERRWDEAREDEVARLKALLVDDPAAAVRGLGRTGHGCRWLTGRWERLLALLEDGDGAGWHARDRDEAIRLQGFFPDRERIHASADAVLTQRHHERVFPEQSDGGFGPGEFDIRDILLSPSWGKPPPDKNDPAVIAERARGREWLRRVIVEHLEELRAREPGLRLGSDEPSRAAAVELALVPEGAAGANWLRYERMHELAFHRAYKALVGGREKAAETGLPPGAPNEANEVDADDSSIKEVETSVAATGPDPGPPAPPAARFVGEVSALAKTIAGAMAPNEAKKTGRTNTTDSQIATSITTAGAVGARGEVTAAGSPGGDPAGEGEDGASGTART